MKLWRKMGNKITFEQDGKLFLLTGREFKRMQQSLSSKDKAPSDLLVALINRI